MNYELNKEFIGYKDFLLNIKSFFDSSDKIIHRARNVIKKIEFNKVSFIVKSFKRPNFLKALYYSKTSSKAKRSFLYSLKIYPNCPAPLGYIEFFSNKLLQDSYFIAKEFRYDLTVRDILDDKNLTDRDDILKEFGKFSYALHQKNILHKDYSGGNILIKRLNSGYEFKIVDLNRVIFKPLSIDERLKNFNMLWLSDNDMKIIITEYAKLANINKAYAINKAINYAFRLKLRKNFKKLLKGKVENIDW